MSSDIFHPILKWFSLQIKTGVFYPTLFYGLLIAAIPALIGFLYNVQKRNQLARKRLEDQARSKKQTELEKVTLTVERLSALQSTSEALALAFASVVKITPKFKATAEEILKVQNEQFYMVELTAIYSEHFRTDIRNLKEKCELFLKNIEGLNVGNAQNVLIKIRSNVINICPLLDAFEPEFAAADEVTNVPNIDGYFLAFEAFEFPIENSKERARAFFAVRLIQRMLPKIDKLENFLAKHDVQNEINELLSFGG